jgi:DNA-binding transcriptional regulator YbjK
VRERGRARRQALLEAALRVIARDGIGGVTHRAVAAEAGVPASATTYFFDSLDHLVVEAVRWAVGEELARLEAIREEVARTDAPVDALIDLVVDQLERDDAQHTVAQFEIYLHASRVPELQPAVAEIVGATVAVAEHALRLGGTTDPAAGIAVTALVDGLSLHRLAAPSPQQLIALRHGLRALAVGFAALQHAGGIAATRHEPPA